MHGSWSSNKALNIGRRQFYCSEPISGAHLGWAAMHLGEPTTCAGSCCPVTVLYGVVNWRRLGDRPVAGAPRFKKYDQFDLLQSVNTHLDVCPQKVRRRRCLDQVRVDLQD